MTARIINWRPGAASLGPAVVAIGVFDGVHVGHQALLLDTGRDAAARGVQSVALTFDRDPDQVVAPETAASQLLTLDDKLAAMARTGVDTILVVPFIHELAQLDPEQFLHDVLLEALRPLAVHVGRDFRFGRWAAGDVETLVRSGEAHGFYVVPHELVEMDGQAVTSTRIRNLVAGGEIAEATRLLGGHPCVTGTVHRGRGEGLALGFPTANVVPVKFAALPSAGVYAGSAILVDGSRYPAAISVGTPPMFPEAKDDLEAHLLGFEGDLYRGSLTLEFWDRLRDQKRFGSLDELKAAIAEDASRALETVGHVTNTTQRTDGLHAPTPRMPETTEGWVPVASRQFSIVAASPESFALVAPLDAAGIPFAWDPYAPQETPQSLRLAMTRDFTVLVPPDRAAEAQALLAEAEDADLELAEDDSSFEDDPAALEAAEKAVHDFTPDQPAEFPGEGLVPVLADAPFAKERFLAIDAALEAAGIEHVWEPFPPQESPLLRLGIWNTQRFSVSVRESQYDTAVHLLARLSESSDA